jgi:hypothetical protein
VSIVKPQFGTPTTITITLASLGAALARESASVDNTSNLFQDAFVVLTVKLATGTPADLVLVNIYASGSEDGTNWGDNSTGVNAAITLRNNTNLNLVGQITTPDSGSLVYVSQPFSVAAVFGGVLPPFWSIIVENRTNLAFDSTGNSLKYTGMNLQVV